MALSKMGSRRAAGGQPQGEDQLSRDNGGTMRRGTGGQHLLDIEEEALTGTTVTVR